MTKLKNSFSKKNCCMFFKSLGTFCAKELFFGIFEFLDTLPTICWLCFAIIRFLVSNKFLTLTLKVTIWWPN